MDKLAAGLAGTAGRETQVRTEMHCLESAVKDLHNVISDLFSKLESVTVPATPKTETGDKVVRQVLVPLAEDIWRQAALVGASADTLRELMQRLEI